MGRFNKFLMHCNNLDPICQYKYILRGAFQSKQSGRKTTLSVVLLYKTQARTGGNSKWRVTRSPSASLPGLAFPPSRLPDTTSLPTEIKLLLANFEKNHNLD